jgi:ferredoxin--NADP+ reductase
MAHLALSQATVAVPFGSDYCLRKSGFKTNNLSFHDKSWALVSTLDLKTKNGRPRDQRTLCMSVQQASIPKVAVSPLELENANGPPLNLYKPKEPYTATIVSVERLVGPKAPGETCHIVIDHAGNVPYWEGQSYGVIPPGENPKKPGSPHNVRLYSIASTRYGDSFDGKTASLCVRRAVYYDPET